MARRRCWRWCPRAAVRGVAVHPSNRFALSVGDDKALRMWNLVKGRAAAGIKLPAGGTNVVWAPDATRYVAHTRRRDCSCAARCTLLDLWAALRLCTSYAVSCADKIVVYDMASGSVRCGTTRACQAATRGCGVPHTAAVLVPRWHRL